MTYCRVDYDNGIYEYFPNDDEKSDRSYRLERTNYACIRMRKLSKLPENKKTGIIYHTEKALNLTSVPESYNRGIKRKGI